MLVVIEKTRKFTVFSRCKEDDGVPFSPATVNLQNLPPRPWDYRKSYAVAKTGDLATMKAMHAGNPPLEWDRSTCMQAASYGHLEMLQWMHSQGCPWDYRTTRAAAERGDIAMLAWLREPHVVAGTGPCPWNSDTAAGACAAGQFEALVWMVEGPGAGAGTSTGTGVGTDIGTCTDTGVPLDAGCCAAAAQLGRLDMLQYLRRKGCAWDKNACYSAAEVRTVAC
jgi:hypothetical protein